MADLSDFSGLRGRLTELASELADWVAQHGCICGHPACSRCADTRRARQILGEAVTLPAAPTPRLHPGVAAEQPLDWATNHSLLCPSPTASPCVEHVGVVMRERLPGDGGDVAYPRLWRPLPAGTELYALPTVGPEQARDPDGWLIAFVEQDGERQSRRTFFQREKPAGEYLGCATPVWFVNAGGAS